MRTATALFFISAALCCAQTSQYSITHLWWNAGEDDVLGWDSDFADSTGQVRVSNSKGSIRTKDHPFFEALGKNGRACVTCHQPANAMSLSTATIRQRWVETAGKDPLFAAVDGSNCPSLPQDYRASHSLLIDRGLFRVALPWPPRNVKPDFRLEVVSDPTGCNKSGSEISVYRRPRMSANLPLLVAGPNGAVLMSDGRAPTLRDQAIDAALVHEEAAATPTSEQLSRILDFENQVFATQFADNRGGLMGEGYAPADGLQGQFRQSAARGAGLFNEHCASCHQPGTNRWRKVELPHSAALPTFKATCSDGRTFLTQDPGRALISGKCEDIGAITVPQFRGLPARAPYFSNGAAETLENVVEIYENRLHLTWTAQQKRDLVNYLSTL